MQPARVTGNNGLGIKSQNLRTLMLTLLRQQPISRVRLARETTLSTTTVTNLVAALVEQGVVAEAGTDLEAAMPGAGRPPQAMVLRPDSRCSVGVHIGVRHARIAL